MEKRDRQEIDKNSDEWREMLKKERNMIENRFTSIRLIDGRPRKVIVDETGDIVNRTPSREELKGLAEDPIKKQKYTKKRILEIIRQFYEEEGRIPTGDDFRIDLKYPSPRIVKDYFGGSWNDAIKDAGLWNKRYNDTHTCYRCGKSFDEIERLGGYPRKERDEKGNVTGKWDCPACWKLFDPNSQNNLVKSVRDSRTGNLNPDSSRGKGDLGEELTNRWRGTRNLNKENDNYNYPIDHSRDPELGIIQTKIAWYDSHKCWQGNFRNEHNKDFDYSILHCVNEDGNIIERTYIIPEEEVKKRISVCIVKYRTSGLLYENGWYEEYRLKDEKEKKKINDIWKEILDEENLMKIKREKEE